MSWIKKDETVEAATEQSGFSQISESNAYEVEVIGCHIQESKVEGSKSISMMVELRNDDSETAREYFTVLGKDGNSYFVDSKGKKKEHFGLGILNTFVFILTGKEVYDYPPTEMKYQQWDNENKGFIDVVGEGYPDLIGKKIGVKIQMIRETDGMKSKDYPSIFGFFNTETGLSAGEVRDGDKKTKLDKWLDRKKDYKIIEKKEIQSSFSKPADGETKSRWGR